MVKRLVNANIRRRNRIFFATEKMRKEKARREEKKRKELVVVDPKVSNMEGPKQTGEQPEVREGPERKPEGIPEIGESTIEPQNNPPARQGSFNEQSQAPTSASTIPLDVVIEQAPSNVAGTTITRATGIAQDQNYPSRPKWPKASTTPHIDCPYCSEPLTEKHTKNEIAWT
jgi:hypothetical protein